MLFCYQLFEKNLKGINEIIQFKLNYFSHNFIYYSIFLLNKLIVEKSL